MNNPIADFGNTAVTIITAVTGLVTAVGALYAAYRKGLHTPVPEPKDKGQC